MLFWILTIAGALVLAALLTTPPPKNPPTARDKFLPVDYEALRRSIAAEKENNPDASRTPRAARSRR